MRKFIKTTDQEKVNGDYLSMQNDVIESTDISNVSIKELLSHDKAKQGVTQFSENQVANYLESQDISFVVGENG